MSRKVVKVAMVGSGGAGKTTIASRLATGDFQETIMTVGLNVETWEIVEEGEDRIQAAIFDLGGQSQFRFFQGYLLGGTVAVLIVVDVTRFKSIIEVDDWLNLIRHVPVEQWILVANKIDEPISISEEDIREKADELGVPYVWISAKTGENFDELIVLLKDIIVAQSSE